YVDGLLSSWRSNRRSTDRNDYLESLFDSVPESESPSALGSLTPRLTPKSIYEYDWYKPLVAENGSYYGEISDVTFRPKTVYVKAYYRKDGTYVRSHYRSK